MLGTVSGRGSPMDPVANIVCLLIFSWPCSTALALVVRRQIVVLFCSVPFSCSCYLLFQLTRQRLIQCKRAKDPILPFHHTSSLPIWPGKKKKKQMFKLLQTRSDSVAAFCSPNSSGNNATVTKDYQMQWHNYRVFSQLYCRHRCSSQIVNRIELRMPIGKN